MKTCRWNHKGFTLAEMAIVVLLGSIMLSMGVKVYTVIRDHSAYSDTRSKQKAIQTALVGYLRNNKRLPPADTNLSPDGTINAGGGWGVLPYRDLGLPRDAVQDGWGNYFSYRVSNTGTGTNWISLAGFDVASYTDPAYVAITVNDAVGQLTNKAVVVVISHGKNGFGAATIRGTTRPNSTAGVTEEDTNAATGDTYHLLDPNPQEGYDDVVAYMTPADLWGPLVAEGTMKVCSAYCDDSDSVYPHPPTCTTGDLMTCVGGGGGGPGTPVPCATAADTPACTSGNTHCSGGTPTCAATTSGSSLPCTTPTVTPPIGALPATCP